MYVERSDEIGGFRFDQDSGQEGSEEVYISSHPGYCTVNNEYREVGLDRGDHMDFSMDFFDEFARKVDEDVTVAVLEEEGTDYSRDFLGDLENGVDYFFETQSGRARPTREAADGFVTLLQELDEGSLVTVSGELNGLCVGQTGQMVEYVSDAYELGLEIDQGVVFPERPLERHQDQLRFVRD